MMEFGEQLLKLQYIGSMCSHSSFATADPAEAMVTNSRASRLFIAM